MTDEAPHLLVDEEDSILIVTLNRPEKLNALGIPLMMLFEQALHRLRDSTSLKVMLIRATGRYFCSGVDLKNLGTSTSDITPSGSAFRELMRRQDLGLHRIFDEMEAVEKPIVVAHHAPCMGGGLELSLSCDFRLAAKSASYAFPEGKMGLLPASNGVSRLTRIVGPHWARLLIMAGMPADADLALTMGLVHRVFPDDAFEEAVMGFCRHLAQQNGEQMGAAKIAIEMAADVGLAQARNVERLANSALMLHPDYLAIYERHVQSVGGKAKKD